MNIDITSAAIATTISCITSASLTIWINKNNEKNKMSEQLDSILKIAIQYPYLENPKFTNTWNENKNSDLDDYYRYDNYHNLVFNFLSRLCIYYNYDKTKIENHISIKDWIRIHRQCWENPSNPYENTDSYNAKFNQFINSYLK